MCVVGGEDSGYENKLCGHWLFLILNSDPQTCWDLRTKSSQSCGIEAEDQVLWSRNLG